MIYTVVGKISEPCESPLKGELGEHVESTKNASLKEARRAVYSLLMFSLRELFQIEEAEICRKENGKPYVACAETEKKLFISLSHTADLCAVSISDEGEVGADIEIEADETRAQRLERRFAKNICAPKKYLKENLLFFKEGRLSPIPPRDMEFACDGDFGFTDRWVLCEAALKCDGRGLCAINEVNTLFLKYDFIHTKLKFNGRQYSLAVAMDK